MNMHGQFLAVGLATAALVVPAASSASAAVASPPAHRAQTARTAQSVGGQFAIWAQAPGVKALSGDVNHDGRSDILLTGGPGWTTVPVAFSRGDGSFRVTNEAVTNLPIWAQAPGVQAVAGDVNHDGRSDIILAGGPGWTTVPVAFSRGDGSFRVTNEAVTDLPIWAQAPGVKVLSGDVNHDGRADLMLTGGPGWTTVPVAFSRGDGSFRVTNEAVVNLPFWAQAPGVRAVSGDVNKDGRADILLTGGPGWTTVPVAFSRGDGSFRVTNEAVTDLPIWAQAPGVKVLSGDVNHDGRADLMLTGGPGWTTVPVAFSRGDGTFRVTNEAVTNLPFWAQGPGVQALAGNFDRDGRADIALTGGPGWTTLPVGFSRGDGSFRVTNEAI
jgi:FG-GAP-like repeat